MGTYEDALKNPTSKKLVFVNMNLRKQLFGWERTPTFWAPFDDPNDPLKVLIGDPLTMVRATDATYLNDKTGLVTKVGSDILRIERQGALFENQRTNLVRQSEDFTTIWATVGASVVPNDIAAPDGTMTADRLVDDNSQTAARVVQLMGGLTDNLTYAIPVFVKKGTSADFSIRVRDITTFTNRAEIDFEFDGSGVPSVVAEDVGTGGIGRQVGSTGWWEVFALVPANTVVAANGNQLQMHPTRVGRQAAEYTYFWGAQMEEGLFSSSYTPTLAAAVTRNGDLLTFPTSGNLDDTVGSILCDVNLLGIDSGEIQGIIGFGAQGRFMKQQGIEKLALFDGTASTFHNLTWDPDTIYKIGSTWGPAGMAIYFDGAERTGSFDGSLGADPAIRVGSWGATRQLNGHIENLRVFGSQLSSDRMQAEIA